MSGQALLGSVAGIDRTRVAVAAQRVTMREARSWKITVSQMGLQGVLANGDGVEIGRTARRDVADLDLGAARPGRRGGQGEQRDQKGCADR